MAISISSAKELFRFEAMGGSGAGHSGSWARKIEHLSLLCEQGNSATHIAFLGTALLAKSVTRDVDLRAVKPTHAKGNVHAYSARTLCHSVLVPLAAEFGVSLGVNGREPLNNQPYFRMTYLGDATPVRARAQPAFDYMLSLIDELQPYTVGQARKALRAFIAVRRRFQVVYPANHDATLIAWADLASAIEKLVSHSSEGGRRAQAAVAGIFDVVEGPDQIESGRINDPSRHYPGDVAVKGKDGQWLKAVEVRDKPVSESDIYLFGQNCLARGVSDAAVVLASPRQKVLPNEAIYSWAVGRNLGLTLYYGWNLFVDQALFWARDSKPEAAAKAVASIESRLISVEASPEAVAMWHSLTRLGSG